MSNNNKSTNSLAILIVSYNVEDYLEKCLLSLKNKLSDISYELVIIDNASQDSSVSVAKKVFPSSTIIQMVKNIGFGRAINIGAQAVKADHYLILNPDTEIENDIIHKMILHMKEHPDVGVVGCRMLISQGKIQSTTYRLPSLFGTICSLSSIKVLAKFRYLKIYLRSFSWLPVVNEYLNSDSLLRSQSYISVTSVPGSCFLVDGDLFLGLKGFDENIFLYMEDSDFFYRVVKNGKKIHLLRELGVIHHVGKSFSSEFTAISPYRYWSTLYYFRKNHTPVKYSIVVCCMLLTTLIKYFWHRVHIRQIKGRDKYLRDCWRVVKMCVAGISSFDPFCHSDM